MSPVHSRNLKWLPRLLTLPLPEPWEQAARILAVQRNIVLPVRGMVTAVVFYYLFWARWLDLDEVATPREVVMEALQHFFIFYILFNAVAAILLVLRRFPPNLVQWVVFVVGLLDGVLLAALTAETGGFGSDLFWVFPGLIVLNSVSIPLATPQIVLNLTLSALYLGSGLLNTSITEGDATMWWTPPIHHRVNPKPLKDYMASHPPIEQIGPETSAEPFILQLIILWMLTASCYGVQLLAFRDRQAIEDSREAAARNNELKAAGRLAAEIAHQLKNPLGIINNAAYSLGRGLRTAKPELQQQLEIIREEVERSDRIITQLMGYAQLSEGRVEKLDVAEDLDRAINEVFPSGSNYATEVVRNYGHGLPALMMQRSHLAAAIVNLLQNAREACRGAGRIEVSARVYGEGGIEINIADDGPGIPPDKMDAIFEAYFTTKDTGTGLGLAIVRHNVELYGGTAAVESRLGQGARFILLFPARSLVR